MVDLTESKRKLRAIMRKTLFILIILVLLSFFKTNEVILGVVLGGGVTLLNLYVIGKVVETMFQQVQTIKIVTAVSYIIQIIILFGVVYCVATYKSINLIAFAVGFSTFVLGTLAEIIYPSRCSSEQ